MTRSRALFRSILFLTLAALLGAPATAFSQAPLKRLIRVEVRPPGQSPIKSLVEEGESLRIEDHSHDRILEFKPFLGSKPAKVQVLEIRKDPNGKETEILRDEAHLEIGPDSLPAKVFRDYTVRILEVLSPKS